jgi:hypothetical protein
MAHELPEKVYNGTIARKSAGVNQAGRARAAEPGSPEFGLQYAGT